MTISVGNELVPIVPTEEALEASSDPTATLLVSCERAKFWLANAVNEGHIDDIINIKAQAEAAQALALALALGKDAVLIATEIVRRSEDALGRAVRKGQEEGTIAKPGSIGANPGPRVGGQPGDVRGGDLVRPADIFTSDSEREDAYRFADASNDAFEEAIEEAKAEENLSRANVVRKIKKAPAPTKRPEVLRRAHHIKPNRVVQATVDAAAALSVGRDLYDYAAVDPALIPGWVSSLEESIRFLTTLKKNLNKELTRRAQQ